MVSKAASSKYLTYENPALAEGVGSFSSVLSLIIVGLDQGGRWQAVKMGGDY